MDIELAEPQALAGFSMERFGPRLVQSRHTHLSVNRFSTTSRVMTTYWSSTGKQTIKISGLRHWTIRSRRAVAVSHSH